MKGTSRLIDPNRHSQNIRQGRAKQIFVEIIQYLHNLSKTSHIGHYGHIHGHGHRLLKDLGHQHNFDEKQL